MSGFKLTIDTTNAAFHGGDGAGELASMLHAVAERIEMGHLSGTLEIHGNTVGNYGVSE